MTPCRSGTLTIATQTFLDDPFAISRTNGVWPLILGIRPVPPPTLVDNRKTLNLRSELGQACRKVRGLTHLGNKRQTTPAGGLRENANNRSRIGPAATVLQRGRGNWSFPCIGRHAATCGCRFHAAHQCPRRACGRRACRSLQEPCSGCGWQLPWHGITGHHSGAGRGAWMALF